MDITHLLITRFNVEYIEKIEPNLNISVEDWLENRFELFFSFCYPSVINQSERNFFWLVYFDPRTPDKYLDKIKNNDIGKIIIPVFANTWIEIYKNIKFDLNRIKNSYNGLLITSRLDNDDAISINYIKIVQDLVRKNFLKKEEIPFSIDLRNGFVYSSSTGLLYSVNKKSNPFISLVELNNKDSLTVFKYQHQEMTLRFKTFSFDKSPLWLQHIHDHNLLNRVYGKLKIFNYKSSFLNYGIIGNIKTAKLGIRFIYKIKDLIGKSIKQIKKKCLAFL